MNTSYQLKKYHYVLYQIVIREVKQRYRGTFLGYIWTLINPVLMMITISLVFSTIFNLDFKSYFLFIFSGLIGFNLFSTIVSQCSLSLISNEQLIKNVYIPKIIFPLCTSITFFIDSLIFFISIYLVLLLSDAKLTIEILFLPVSFILTFLFSFGLSLIVSVASVFFRDLTHILTIIFQILIFLSPVYYKPDVLHGPVKSMVEYNPISQFIYLFRTPIVDNNIPDFKIIFISLFVSTLVLVLGLLIFKKFERKIIFRL